MEHTQFLTRNQFGNLISYILYCHHLRKSNLQTYPTFQTNHVSMCKTYSRFRRDNFPLRNDLFPHHSLHLETLWVLQQGCCRQLLPAWHSNSLQPHEKLPSNGILVANCFSRRKSDIAQGRLKWKEIIDHGRANFNDQLQHFPLWFKSLRHSIKNLDHLKSHIKHKALNLSYCSAIAD